MSFETNLGHFCNHLLCFVMVATTLHLIYDYDFFHCSKKTTFCLVFLKKGHVCPINCKCDQS